jgi:hypothetical protein
MKRPITEESVLITEPYRSIINLLDAYSKGLQPKHIRFALIKDHDWLNPHDHKRCKKDLGSKLSRLYSSGKIKRDCVTSKVNLNHKLRTLVTIGVIFKDKRTSNYQKPRYKLVDKHKFLQVKVKQRDIINETRTDHIWRTQDNQWIYGLATNTYYTLSQDDKRFVAGGLSQVDSILRDVANRINKRLLDIWVYKFRRIITKYNLEELEDIIVNEIPLKLWLYIWTTQENIPDDIDGIELSNDLKDELLRMGRQFKSQYGDGLKLYIFNPIADVDIYPSHS